MRSSGRTTAPLLRPHPGLLLIAALASALLFGPSTPAAAQSESLTGFGFLRLEPSARAAALGGSFGAIYGEDVNGFFYNPALLNPEMDGTLSVSYLNHVAGLDAGFVAYGREFSSVGTMALGVRYLGWGDMDEADEEGEVTGSFGASDVALTVGVARPFSDQLRYGINLHGIVSHVGAFAATALAADAGLVYRFPAHDLALSASVSHAGRTLGSLGETRDELPLNVRVGAAKRLRHVPLLLSVTGYDLQNVGGEASSNALGAAMRHVALGAEFQFSEAFNLRFGYNHRQHEDLKMKSRLDLAGFGTGFGLKVSRIRLDYAYNSWSSLGGLHQLTVRTKL